jgi:hypothetical protein
MKIENEKSYPFQDALNESQCRECSAGLEYEAAFDADGTNYSAECCGLIYTLSPETVKASVETS